MSKNLVFQIGEHEEVCCYHCLDNDNHDQYKKGEAFLAGPGHSPCDGDSHYICKAHLDKDAVISNIG